MWMNTLTYPKLCMHPYLNTCSCAGEFNRVFKSADDSYKYEYAKEAFANNKFQQATALLEQLVTIK